jgi:hypothetical protein
MVLINFSTLQRKENRAKKMTVSQENQFFLYFQNQHLFQANDFNFEFN